MTAFADMDEVVNRLTGGNSGNPQPLFPFKDYRIALTADTWAQGLMYSTWLYDGYPGGASAPTTVAAPTSATAGAIPFTNASGGRQLWLMQALATAGNPDNLSGVKLYDRLLHIGNLDGTNTGAQTVGGSLTRNTGGVGNEIWIEIYTAVGTTARTITASYTNSAGSSGRTTQAVTFGGAAGTVGNDANLLIQLPLQAGDLGVQAVASVTIAGGSTGTAGNFGVVVAHPLGWLTMGNTNGEAHTDFTIGPSGGPRVIDDNACLAFMLLAGSTTETMFHTALSLVER